MPYETPHLPSRALCLPEDARSYDRMTKDGVWKLLQSETDWVKRQSFLERSGYALRSRYREGWSPSWLGTLRDPTFCEDSIRLIVGYSRSHPAPSLTVVSDMSIARQRNRRKTDSRRHASLDQSSKRGQP